MRERITLDKSAEHIQLTEAKGLKRISDLNEIVQDNPFVTKERKKESYRYVVREIDRLSPCNKFDHEEVWVGTGIYTTGNIKNLKPNI